MPIAFHMIAGAPEPVATFSHATEVDGWVFVTGQMPTVPGRPHDPLPEGITAQTDRVMENLSIVLAGLGLTLADVTMARGYLLHFDRDYTPFNEAYKRWFANCPRAPASGSTGSPRARSSRSIWWRGGRHDDV